jgi:WG containing repeat
MFSMKFKISKYGVLKTFTLLFLVTLIYSTVNGQSKKNWYYFRDKKTGLIGYKDRQGNIKIPAKFGGFTGALVFRDIIAVTEDKTGQSYYLLKNGKKIGSDSLYVWDNDFDNLIEDKIRFRDKKTGKVGFFNKNGKIIIPAVYNDARPFHNGLALVVHNGKRVCLDGSMYNDSAPCEHWFWNGISALIDTHNHIVADDISIDDTDDINWFALKIELKPDTTLYTSFKDPEDKFYSFLNYKKEFKKWFYKIYLSNLNQSVSANCYKELVVEDKFKDRVRRYYSKTSFLKRYQTLLIKKMKTVKAGKVETTIFDDDLNDYIYNGKNFSMFYTTYGVPDKEKHPLFDVVSTYYEKNKQSSYQEHYSFLRTDSGYKLIEIALNVGLNN